MKYFHTICFLMLMGVTACVQREKKKLQSTFQSMPDVEKIRLLTLNGDLIPIKQYAGKTLFINFWATWCKPCIQEMPFISEAQTFLQKENIIFLMASDESAEQIAEFKNANKFNFNYVRIENSAEMNIGALPTTFIFNGKGNLVFSETGMRKWNAQANLDLILKIVKQNE